MSSRDYGIDDYGLLLNQDTLKVIASNLCDDYTDELFEEDPFGFIDELVDTFDLTYCSDFTGEALSLDDDGCTQWVSNDSVSFSDDLIFYLPLRRYASLFKASYGSMDEVISEVKDTLGKYLPTDFNYRPLIKHITGTYWSS